MQDKFDKLKNYLTQKSKQGICLAYSGGVDSCVLLYICKDLNLVAVTFKSVFQTNEEVENAINICNYYGVRHKVIEYNPLADETIKNNPKDRCYHCKKLIFSKLKELATSKLIIDGTNADDLKTYRPGVKALKELEIFSPLAEFNIAKDDIRNFAKLNEIKNFDKPSNPCLATRLPYNTLLCEKDLNLVRDGEKIIRECGFNSCRLRLHNDVARIEIPVDKFPEFIEVSDKIVEKLKNLGVKYAALDLIGLRSGSMDV